MAETVASNLDARRKRESLLNGSYIKDACPCIMRLREPKKTPQTATF